MGEQYTGSTRIFSLQKMGELLDQGVPLESIDKDGKTFLRHACADGKSSIAEFLLDRGADPNSQDNEGKTSLMSAAMTGRFEIVKLLLDHGADPKIDTPSGDSALKMAQRWGQKEIVQILLEKIEQGSAERPASGATNEQSTPAPAESIAIQPIPEKREEAPISEIAAPKSRIVESDVVHAVVRPVAEPETPPPGKTEGVSITTTVVDVTVTVTETSPADTEGFRIPELTTKDYEDARDKMKASPNDRVGTAGSVGATGLGVVAGVAAAGKIATVFGATTLLGSSTLGSVLGGVLVTTTPVGWVIGSVAAAAAIGYGVSKLVRSGAGADARKSQNIIDLGIKIDQQSHAEKPGEIEEKFKELKESLQILVKDNRISQDD
jgi:hypothetical protein